MFSCLHFVRLVSKKKLKEVLQKPNVSSRKKMKTAILCPQRRILDLGTRFIVILKRLLFVPIRKNFL